MIRPFLPGHLAKGGELLLPLKRRGVCACGSTFVGPPTQGRCPDCAREHRRKYKKRWQARKQRDAA